jgi:hypothetical protein
MEDVILKLMLLLLIKNDNVSMLEYILSNCSHLSLGAIDIFEHAVHLQKMQIIHVFLNKYHQLAYYAVFRGSYLNDEPFVKEVSQYLCQDRRRLPF